MSSTYFMRSQGKHWFIDMRAEGGRCDWMANGEWAWRGRGWTWWGEQILAMWMVFCLTRSSSVFNFRHFLKYPTNQPKDASDLFEPIQLCIIILLISLMLSASRLLPPTTFTRLRASHDTQFVCNKVNNWRTQAIINLFNDKVHTLNILPPGQFVCARLEWRTGWLTGWLAKW